MSNYIIKQISKDSESFGNYNYDIYLGTKLVAKYWHDFRGNDHGLYLPNVQKQYSLPCRMTEFMSGGGPNPLVLTDWAMQFLEKIIIKTTIKN